MPEITDAEYRQFMTYQTHGTPDEIRKKRTELESDNKAQRDEIRDLKTQVPPEGQLLISAEDAKALTTYREFGDPVAVKTKLDAGVAALNEVNGYRVRSTAGAFAKVAGLADEALDTLIAIPALSGASFEVRTKKDKDDKGKDIEVQVPYVTLPGEGEKAMSFEDAQAKIPALKGLRLAAVPGKPAIPFVQQGGEPDKGGDGSTVFDKIRKEAAEKKAAATKLPAKSLEERMGMATAS